MEKQEYYLGLDMGTNSVGWAVTDTQYRILRAKGKDMWGIREFEEAKTAEKRRMHRTSRRNRQREVVRLGMVKSYFDNAISEVDPCFFARLENSKYLYEDKDECVRGKHGVFADEEFTDKDYYAKYRTVYHLIMDLIENEDPHDVRLVYLAIANLFKRRGHFLNAINSSENESQSIQAAYDQLVSICAENQDLTLPNLDASKIEEILKDRNLSKTVKSEKLMGILEIKKSDKVMAEIAKAIAGRKVNAYLIFAMDEKEDKAEFAFSDSSFEDAVPDLMEKVGEDNFAVINAMREIYDIGTLAEIMHGYKYLSESRVADYRKHKEDLILLKSVIKDNCDKTVYNELFRLDGPGSYSAYVNSTLANGKKKRRNMKERKREDLYKNLKKILSKVSDSRAQDILNELDNETFLPKMLTPSNGIIPNQVHYRELKKILENAEKYLSFLKEKDQSGLTVSERILSLYKFRIPYYVGPVSNRDGKGNGWAVRKEDGAVLPWNLEEKIDLSKTKEAFIENLVRKCTYLSGEKVLPKSALIYEKYKVLNEINNIRIRDERISVELKQEIYNQIFKRGKRVTRKTLVKYLVNRGLIDGDNDISGIDVTINNALTSYGRFKSILGDEIEKDAVRNTVEEIIKIATVYGDDKTELRKVLKKQFGDLLDEQQIKKVASFRFADWGRFSRAFLEMEAVNYETGEVTSLIQELWNSQLNLMELLHSERYSFEKVLQDKTSSSEKELSEFRIEDLDGYYFSAPVKRMTWQTILLIREISKIQGHEPSRIFVEMTRTDEEKGDKGRKTSRARDLIQLYKNIKTEIDNKKWIDLINKEDETGRLKSKKLYLYIKQMGKDMYTGEQIDLDRLFEDNLYDIDHIYPRHFVKDNNLENNLVLVDKTKNNRKDDNYPIDIEIRNKPEVRRLWKILRETNLMSEEKYRRLTGNKAFTDEDKAGFIARQLVETSQATKGVADILKDITHSEIVYSKAGNVSDFRRDYDIPKSRIVNDFHHAHDAYLNIVVGNAYYTKFTKDPRLFIRNEYNKDKKVNNYNLDHMFEHSIVRNGYTAWLVVGKDKKEGTIKTVKAMLAKNTPLMTRMTFVENGKISDENLCGKMSSKEGIYLSVKGSDPRMTVAKYGGYNDVKVAYFFLVEHELNGKKVRTIENVPVYLLKIIENSEKALTNYCVEKLGLVKPSIRVKQIKMQSLLKLNGYFANLTGKSLKQLLLRNAVNLKQNASSVHYIHLIEKYHDYSVLDERVNKERNAELYCELTNKQHQQIYMNRPTPVYKKLDAKKDAFKKLPIEDQCRVLYQILSLTMIGKTKANLSLIGESPNVGEMRMPQKISGMNSIKLINQSVTGLYESEIDLLTV
ncbi:MAG: type II CRISPR RNA-guided endonuclease Cas9 [Bacillota bacterium]|nr:type II CRISPR RNA-guided endonuclease Cas9 [Bacillota bacterium]